MKDTVSKSIKYAAGNGKEFVIKAGWRESHFAEKNGLTDYSAGAIAEYYESGQTQLAAHLQTRAKVDSVGKATLRVVGEGDDIKVVETVNVRYELGETDQNAKAAELLNTKAVGAKQKGIDYANAAQRYKNA